MRQKLDIVKVDYLEKLGISVLRLAGEKLQNQQFCIYIHEDNIKIIKPCNLNWRFQQLSITDILNVLKKAKQWFSTEFDDFKRDGLTIKLSDEFKFDLSLRKEFRNPDLHLLCELKKKKNTVIMYRNSHLSRKELLGNIDTMFVHEIAHIKWFKLPIEKKLQYFEAYKADNGFSFSQHSKNFSQHYNISIDMDKFDEKYIMEDFARCTERFVRFREEYREVEQVRHRFEVIGEWMGE